jgi:hypothetical protein
VVLSACETGVGEVRTGEGVYGLRRALMLGGSESQVMSVWKVSDEATRDLMAAYYKRLMAGEGRTEAYNSKCSGTPRPNRPRRPPTPAAWLAPSASNSLFCE